MADAATVLDEDLADVTLADEIACAKRELAMRERVYAGWVERGKMKPGEAAREIRRMKAILKRLLIAERDGRLL